MMKLLRYLAFPLVPFYFLVTWLRNMAFDFGVLKSKTYDFPVICVGNLSAGGTGKSPMVGYLISLLKDKKRLATLSRGYGRETKGFVLAKDGLDHASIGDESFQYYQNFKDEITVAVCEDRQTGISNLRSLKQQPEVIVLDDAYQHRKVTAGFNVLLSTYSNLFVNDMVLPTGDLREPKSGYKRADVIVVTKCPENIDSKDKAKVIKAIKPLAHQHVFFSRIQYSKFVLSSSAKVALENLSAFTLVTGIANAKPLVSFLESKKLEFNHLEYSDHYNFTKQDINNLAKLDKIVTTEKDYMRLQFEPLLADKLFYLPITVELDKPDLFNRLIVDYAIS